MDAAQQFLHCQHFYLAVDLVQLRRAIVMQCASYFAFSFETIFKFFPYFMTKCGSGNSIVCPQEHHHDTALDHYVAARCCHHCSFQYPVSHYSDMVRFQMVSLEFFIDIKSFRSHHGPGVDSASNRNEYQEYFLGVKAAGA